jgi:glycosyltransferase involved in cell wall biosynthesis
VVVSDLPWAREELVDGREALVVPVDTDAVANAIGRILDEQQATEELGKHARELAVAELDPARATARIDALYRSVVEAA